MPTGVAHSQETRDAVLAALLAGDSASRVSRELRVARTTVLTWRDQAGIGATPVRPERREAINARVVDLLDQILATLRAQAAAFDDPAWLKEHPPSEAATLWGVLADKAIYLGATLEAPDDDDP